MEEQWIPNPLVDVRIIHPLPFRKERGHHIPYLKRRVYESKRILWVIAVGVYDEEKEMSEENWRVL